MLGVRNAKPIQNICVSFRTNTTANNSKTVILFRSPASPLDQRVLTGFVLPFWPGLCSYFFASFILPFVSECISQSFVSILLLFERLRNAL